MVVLYGMLASASLGALVLTLAFSRPTLRAALAPLLLAFVSWVIFLFTLGERRRARAAAEPRCPYCGYELAGLSDALFPAIVSVRLGPRRCPECGESWPLIPTQTIDPWKNAHPVVSTLNRRAQRAQR